MIDRLYLYQTDCVNPYHNLAIEEYLTFHTQPGECILYLWQNQHTVVIGRNQNCYKECKVQELESAGGFLARRLSGGGAVYHDLGNLNFTFCVPTQDYNLDRQLDVILSAVQALGVAAEKTGRNDVTVNGKKFSGNAFYHAGPYSYHHGTLLVCADQTQMARFLNVSKEKLKSKGVDSVRKRTGNLTDFEPTVTIASLKEALISAFGKVYGLPVQALPEGKMDFSAIAALEAKFSSPDWKYGSSVLFQNEWEHRFSWGNLDVQFRIQSGEFEQVHVFTDAMDADLSPALAGRLEGCQYDAAALDARLADFSISPDHAGEEIRRWLMEMATE